MKHLNKAAILASVVAVATPAMADDWTGFYIGAHGGYGEVSGGGADNSDFLGGVQAGYNYDFGGWVLGAEVDYSFDNRSFGASTMDDTWSLKGKVGYAFNDTMVYGTVGGVRGGIASGGTTTYDNGYIYGVGVEQRLASNWSVAGEILQTRFDSFGGGADVKDTKAVLKVNYRF
ncbi:outer membrane protein [Shimia biformata]|uniref:outer membrane protein n=1 Tax=Shimia biformata TaxID=1294299 RepID=UPI001951810B|nr:outer membrane beta-barrel protein [Shimia biformata]